MRMKIVLATPLYPPDISEPAPYIKELARRLAPKHEVVIVATSYLPEAVDGVRIQTVNKHRPLLIRLFFLTLTLLQEAKHADIIIIENGASTEFAGGIVARLISKPFIMHIGDVAAHERTKQSIRDRILEAFLSRRAASVINDPPPHKPEILPFTERLSDEQTSYDTWWSNHIARLNELMTYANRS